MPPDYDARDYAPAITPAQANATARRGAPAIVPSRDEVLAQGTQLPDLRLDLHVYDAESGRSDSCSSTCASCARASRCPRACAWTQITRRRELSYRGTQFTLDGN